MTTREQFLSDEQWEEFPAYDMPGWHTDIVNMINEADEAGVLAPGGLLWMTADSDGLCDGWLITVDVTPEVRIASPWADFGELTPDRDLEGTAAVEQIIDTFNEAVEELRAKTAPLCSCGSRHWTCDDQEAEYAPEVAVRLAAKLAGGE